MAITKKLMTECIKQEIAEAIPERKCSRKGNHQHPLFAWIQGAHKIAGKSKIECVVDNQTSWPWTTHKAAGHEFTRRVCEKRNLSFLQKYWLNKYVERRFCGVYKDRWVSIDGELPIPERSKNFAIHCSREVDAFVAHCIAKAGANPSSPPLRLILSPKVTILINLKFMELYL